MAITRRLRRTAMAMGIGAAMSYFLDPVQGPGRRRGVGEKVRAVVESRGAAGGSGQEGTLLTDTDTDTEAETGSPFSRTDVRPGAHSDPTGGAAPVQGVPAMHSADVMG